MLANDWDPDYDDIDVVVMTYPANGELSYNPEDGSFTYEADEDYYGIDEIEYYVTDGEDNSETVVATINVFRIDIIRTAVPNQADSIVTGQTTTIWPGEKVNLEVDVKVAAGQNEPTLTELEWSIPGDVIEDFDLIEESGIYVSGNRSRVGLIEFCTLTQYKNARVSRLLNILF